MAGALEISLKFILPEFPIDQYDRLEKLGDGAYGTVYLYEHRRDDVSDELLPSNQSVLPNLIAVKTFQNEYYFQIEKNNKFELQITMNNSFSIYAIITCIV